MSGGNGGKAGDGGYGRKQPNHGDYQPGGGGGGYGGGGAGDDPGNGNVNGSVGVGGEAALDIYSTEFTISSSDLRIYGGNGGDGGKGATGFRVVGGGGGYGGGSHCDAERGKGNLYGDMIGNGGNCTVNIVSDRFMMSNDSILDYDGGKGGNAPTSPGGGTFGGEGTGRTTSPGSILQNISMSITVLISPENNSFTDEYPTFEWFAYHNSTYGPISNHTIMVDNNKDFSSPEIFNITTFSNYTPTMPLTEETYYWRVWVNYSSPPGSSTGWSEVWKFAVLLIEPLDLNIIVDSIKGNITLNWTQRSSLKLDHYNIYRSGNPHSFNFLTPYNNSLSWSDPLATNWTDPDSGAGLNDFPYFYIVRGVNTTGYEEQNQNIVGKYVQWLDPGWNLISIPLKQSSTSLDQVLSTISGKYDIVQWKNPVDGNWLDSNGGLMDIDRFMGLWIHMKTSAKLITNGSVVNSVIHLTEGWNLVGYPSFSETSVVSEFSDVPSFEAAQCYNNSNTNDHWKHFKESKSLGNDLTSMKSGLGYWVYVSMDYDWIVEY
jgi:hypothetical protein